MNPWTTNPVWQNFASMYRETIAATEAPIEMHRFHHLTSALYFGIASVEAFLNRQMRTHLSGSLTEDEIHRRLRAPIRFVKKLQDWPKQILSSPLVLDEKTAELLRLFNEIRGDLTHPKTLGRDIYERLDAVNATEIHEAVASYIVCFLSARNEEFPYWLFGWNYQNPSTRKQELAVINNQQFLYSLSRLGWDIRSFDAAQSEKWQQANICSLTGFLQIKKALDAIGRCEPKEPRFPYTPILCRLWWTEEHRTTCGYASPEEVRKAMELDDARGLSNRN